jgi:hypothetical protein
MQSTSKQVIDMQAHEYKEDHESPVSDFVAPIVFVAGLFAVLTLLSSFG